MYYSMTVILVAFFGTIKTEDACGGDSWTVKYEVNRQSLVVKGSAIEGAKIKIRLQSLENTVPGCRLDREAETDILDGEFVTPPFRLCGNTGYSVDLGIECGGGNITSKKKIIWTPPEAPSNVRADRVTESSFLLDWDSPPGGIISAYKIQLNEEIFVQNMSDTHYRADNLRSNTNYTVSVLARGKEEWSQPSDQIVVRTERSLHPPLLRLQHVTNTSVTLDWDDMGDLLYTVRWHQDTDTDNTTTDTNSSSIQVENLTPFVYYNFHLRVSDGNHRIGKWSDVLRVQTKPGVPFPPSNVRVKEKGSRNISLEWNEPQPSRGDITTYSVTWRTTDAVKRRMQLVSTNGIVIEELKPARTYLIQVRASTEAGTGNWSKPLLVTTLSEPPFPPTNITVIGKTESSLFLQWDYPSQETGRIEFFTIQWNTIDNETDSFNMTDLKCTIENLIPFTTYYIRIKSWNEAGSGNWSYDIEEKTAAGVPSSPRNIRKVTVTNSSIEMTWDEPFPYVGPIRSYKLRWMSLKTPVKEEEVAVNSYLIPDMSPYTNYSIAVQARTDAGYGAWSNPVTIETEQGVPRFPIGSLRKKSSTNTSVGVVWESPGDSVGPIVLYKVRWNTDLSHTSDERETENTFYNIRQLEPYTYYSIQVKATTRAGYGPWSKPLRLRTGIGVPSSPMNVRGKEVKNTSIEIEWDIPELDVGPILLYRVRWRSRVEETKETVYLMNDLNPFTNYMVEVQAQTKAGPGNWSKPATIQTSAGIPSPPEKLMESYVTNRSIEIKWEQPRPYRGPIESYAVLWGSHIDATDELKYLITDLSPYTDYDIAVRAKTEAGYGRWSNALRVRTKIGIPSIPTNVSEADKNATYLRLTWLQPHPMNGPLHSYRIEWNVVDDDHRQAAFTNDTSFEFFALLPYTNYLFQVSASTVEGWGQPSSMFFLRTDVAVPPAATITFLRDENSSDVYIAEWRSAAPYPGPTAFQVYVWKWAGQCEGGGRIHAMLNGSRSRNEWERPAQMQVSGLNAYSQYSAWVLLKTEAGETKSNDSGPIETPAQAPGPPTNVRSNCEEKSTEADVSWSLPANPNSKISRYFVEYGSQYLGYREVSVKVNDVCQVQKITIRGLRPERDYKIFVRAVGEGVSQDGKRASPPTSCLLPAGVPPIGNAHWIKVYSTHPTQLTLIWNDIVFSDSMGSLIEYAVIVGMPDTMGTPSQGKVADAEFPMWANYSSGLSKFYQATPSGWNPFLKDEEDPLGCRQLDGDVPHVTLQCTLGLESDCAMNRSHCNAPLRSDTRYMVKLRAFTRGGYSEAAPLAVTTSKSSKSGLIGGLVGGFFAVCFCSLLMFIVILMKRKGSFEHIRKIIESQFAQQTTSQPEIGVELQTHQHGQCIKIHTFCKHVRIMLSDSHLKFSEEFESLKSNSPKFPCTAAEMEENCHKNRWMNIFPYDHSRVKLLPLGDEPASDFINANYIVGDSSLREYIASQGPLANTVDDFWRMIWEQSTTMIVMLTQLIERGKVKCEKYWPDEKEPKYYGDIQVRLISESILSSYIIRVFHLQLGSQERMIKQMHFTHWPDFGCPERPEDLINFVRAVRDHLPRIRPGPIVVHCSAGVGRTGTFISVDRLAQNLLHNDDINIFETVMGLRQHRINMVQTEDQYIYIHLCVQQLVQEIIQPTNQECYDPIYSNVSREMDTDV